jgi:GNAT superfamily N-acetyltransferase
MERDQVGNEHIELELSSNPTSDDIQVLRDGLHHFNLTATGRRYDGCPLAIWIRSGGRVLGGAYGYTHYGWLYLSLLWVDEALRGQGLGTQVIERFEAEGTARGCHAAWLDTYEFQAPTFYARRGYREFGRLEDFPPGSVRFFYWKPLPRAVKGDDAGRDS